MHPDYRKGLLAELARIDQQIANLEQLTKAHLFRRRSTDPAHWGSTGIVRPQHCTVLRPVGDNFLLVDFGEALCARSINVRSCFPTKSSVQYF